MNRLLLVYDPADTVAEIQKLGRLKALHGWDVKITRGDSIQTATDLQLVCKKVGNVAGVICTNSRVLRLVLDNQIDYVDSGKAPTLDSYEGSILDLYELPGIEPAKELLILNPPRHLVTVPYAPFLFERFITKITNPKSWYPQTEFLWETLDVNNPERCEYLLREFARADLIGDDIETIVNDPHRRISVCGFTAYFRKTHTTLSVVIPFDSPAAWSWARKFATLPIRKVFQNGLYDNSYKARWNCLPSHWYWDTQHLFHSWYSELPKSLDAILAFSIRKTRYWKEDGKTGNLHDYYRYNALDHWATVNACLSLIHEMPDWAVANYLEEFPLVFPCLTCALEGERIDLDKFRENAAKEKQKIENKLKTLQYWIGNSQFNPGSWQQVLKLFKLLPGCGALTSTNAIAMKKAKFASPFNDRILTEIEEYRQAVKAHGTYFNEEKLWNGRLYYSLNPAGTDTLRLASRESAYWCGFQIQNIPRGPEVKECIISDPGWLSAEIDKEQSEARCVGYLSGETALIDLVESPRDYHSWNASKFFGIPYEQIYDEERKKKLDVELRDLSKRTNHGANYNMGDGVMLDTMGPKNVSKAKMILRLPVHWKLRKVCAYLLEQYDKTYPNIRGRYYASIVKRIALTGKLVSPLGWTRRFFGKPAENKQHLNSAIAHEPQNLSVHIINREFYALWHDTIYGALKGLVRLKAQIHDSIKLQYRQEYPNLPKEIEQKYMRTKVQVVGSDGIERTMLIPNDVSAGKVRWSELK